MYEIWQNPLYWIGAAVGGMLFAPLFLLLLPAVVAAMGRMVVADYGDVAGHWTKRAGRAAKRHRRSEGSPVLADTGVAAL